MVTKVTRNLEVRFASRGIPHAVLWLREGLLSGSDVYIPSPAKAGAGISVEWTKAAAYTSPVTGETYVEQ